MATWGTRRKALYITTAGLFVFALLGALAYAILSRPSSCFNGVRDGSEQDVDCGGSCSRMCIQSVRPPNVLWTRYFTLAPNTYSVAAYVENTNSGAYVRQARYVFKLFDTNNILIAERQGIAAIAPTRITPIVETNINTGNRTPARAFMEFTATPQWDRALAVPPIRVDSEDLSPSGQRLSVMVHNDDVKDVANLSVAAVLFDAEGQAQAASVSVIPLLERAGQTQVVFTWPLAPKRPIVRAEVVALPTPR